MTAAHSIDNALTVLGVNPLALREHPDERLVAGQLGHALRMQRHLGDLLPVERPAIARELDVRLRALRSGRLPFPVIDREKLEEVLRWRGADKMPALAPFSINHDEFRLSTHWNNQVRPSLPAGLNSCYEDVVRHLNEKRRGRDIDISVSVNFQGFIPNEIRRLIVDVQKQFQGIRVLAEVSQWKTQEFQRPRLDPDPLVIGWDGEEFFLLAAFDLTPLEAAVAQVMSGTLPSVSE